MLLTPENFEKGFLIDDEAMGGVAKTDEGFAAFVVSHATAESLYSETFVDLTTAIAKLNSMPRTWAFERTSECGEGKCGSDHCKIGGCSKLETVESGESGGCEGEICSNFVG